MSASQASLIILGNSLCASGIGQDQLIPALLKTRGCDLRVSACYAPGQTLAGHVLNNIGDVTDSQREGIETGRVGGWFTDEKCDFLYTQYTEYKGRVDAALAECQHDYAIILVSSKDCDDHKSGDTFRFAKDICEKLRANNPKIRIVFYMPWAQQAAPEQLPMRYWISAQAALQNNAILAPVGNAFAASRADKPEINMHRSLKDDHQNQVSSFLIAYTLIAALTDANPQGLPTKISDMQPSYDFEGGTFALENNTGEWFQEQAWLAYSAAKKELAELTPETFSEPIIEQIDNNTAIADADTRILVIGNAWYDNDGKLWDELSNSFAARDDIALHVEAQCDDAATLQSHLTNNAGKQTKRQQRVLDDVQANFTKMNEGAYDMDELDGMGDYPYQMAVDMIAKRKGALSAQLERDVNWDHIFILPFRGTTAPEEHDFFDAGAELIALIRSACPDTTIAVLEPWARQDHLDELDTISHNCQKLADNNSIDLIPIGTAWAHSSSNALYRSRYTPNKVGIQVASEAIRKYLATTEK